MAAQVLSGSGNVSYTNSTGQNVRVVINYLKNGIASGSKLTFQGVSVDIPYGTTFGKTLGYRNTLSGASVSGENQDMAVDTSSNTVAGRGGIPLEFALPNGGTFSITNTTEGSQYIEGYNIIIIPEAG